MLGVLISATITTAQTRTNAAIANTSDLIGRSDIVLQRPNLDASEAMPLGNGRLGAAVWAQDGLTVQLNRADTMPGRLSPGQVVLPGLKPLISAADYKGRLNLFDGSFEESGGGMTAAVYVQPDADTLIIDVTGAAAGKPQTATLRLWDGRHPAATADSKTAMLSESWVDNMNPGSSGERFGSLAGISAEGSSVSAAVSGLQSVTVTVTPDSQGSFRILVASPHFAGEHAAALVKAALGSRAPELHSHEWAQFWARAGAMRISSPDGAGEYMENLRALYLYSAKAESGGAWPGSQAGVGDLFSSVRDRHQWDPAAFWHWNLRMQVAANLGAGVPELNLPYFRLYRDHLPQILAWTRQHMSGAPGVCLPETMRFNGQGIEYESWDYGTHRITGLNCDAGSKPYYNARTLSTGAEVSLWIWEQYLLTGDRAFLTRNFPVMAASARFLLSYEKAGADGLLHTSPSNAHETQWDVKDPTTDISARLALYPAVLAAAAALHVEPALQQQLHAALKRIPPLPRIAGTHASTVVSPATDTAGEDVIGNSYEPGAAIHNVENIGLEPVWPYTVIGDTSPLFPTALLTYKTRPNTANIDWSYDPVQAARLHLGAEVERTLVQITEANQHYVNGFAKWGGNGDEFYVEQIANVALGLQEALVQDYDGLIRIAPAAPPDWDVEGTVAVRGGATVSVSVHKGTVIRVAIKTRTAQLVRVRSPWPQGEIIVRDEANGERVTTTTTGNTWAFHARATGAYSIAPAEAAVAGTSSKVSNTYEHGPRALGSAHLGLSRK